MLQGNSSIITFDAENRVKSVSSGSVCTSFEYDEWNNISCEQIGDTKIAYQYSDTEKK